MKKIFIGFCALIVCYATIFAGGSNEKSESLHFRVSMPEASADNKAVAIRQVVENIQKRTSGRVTFDVYYSAELGTFTDTIESIALGSNIIDGTSGDAYAPYGCPDMTALNLMYMYPDSKSVMKFNDSSLFKEMTAELEKNSGIKMICMNWCGAPREVLSTKPIHSVADCAGMNIRVPENDLFVAMAHAWGSNSKPITFSELYLALQYNIVDGQENPLPTFASAKLQEVQKYVILTGHVMTPALVVINEAAWQKLEAADREILKASLAKNIEWQNNEIVKQENELIASLKAQGITVITPDVESFRVATLKTLPPLFEAKWGKGTWESIQAIQ